MTPSQLKQIMSEVMTDILSDLFSRQEDMTPEQKVYFEMMKHADPELKGIPPDMHRVAMEMVEEEADIVTSISRELGRALTIEEFQQVHETVWPAIVIRKGLEEQIHGR